MSISFTPNGPSNLQAMHVKDEYVIKPERLPSLKRYGIVFF